MKRVASGPTDEPVTKKIKLDDDDDIPFDHPSLQRTPVDVLQNGLSDGSGYISCSCFMTWKPTKKHKAILQTTTGALHVDRFEVEFLGDCAEFFDKIELKARDELLLALKGAKLEILQNASRSCTLRMKLIYQEGVAIRFLKRGGDARTVNTWQLKKAAISSDDAWFLTPPVLGALVLPGLPQRTDIQMPPEEIHSTPPLSEVLKLEPLSEAHVKVSTVASPVEHPKMALTSTQDDAHRQEAERQYISNSTHPIARSKVSKRERKLLRKQGRVQRLNSEHSNTVVQAAITRVVPVEPPATAVPPSDVHDAPDCVNNSMSSTAWPDPTVGRAEAATFFAGLVADHVRYHPLKNGLPANTTCSVIGVVVQITLPRKTRTEEWMCNVKLVDPSNTQVNDLNTLSTFAINCFAKKYEQWLPRPSLGEILVVHDVKISHYHDFPMGIGYSERMKWAIYTPATGQISHGDMGSAPTSEVLADGFGHEFSPLLQPSEAVISYCRKLADWWHDVEEQRRAIGETHQVMGSSHSFTRYGQRRQHRFISEASPDAPPDGYFDCTVEILHGYLNNTGTYSLYVTDYTVNEAITPVQAQWCPAGLADHVLKIEVWDAAVETASTMNAGEYYSIRNARMLMSRGGYVEGKLVQPRIQKLVEEKDTTDERFRSLLERKKAWQEAHNVGNQPNEFEYSTIGAAIERKHFNCIVEMLHVIRDGDAPCIYVTDYTSRDELLSTEAQGIWAQGLKGRILKIALFNSQIETAKSLEAGSLYTIKKLRVKSSTTSRQFQGQLGGPERLIFMHNPKSSDNELDELRQRKEQWNQSLETCSPLSDMNTTQKVSIKSGPYKKVAELQVETKCPNKSRICARVLDFRPWNLQEAVILHCTNCNHDLPTIQRACFRCHDVDHKYVRYMYQLYLLLQDEDGSQLYVSVHDGSSLFKDLKRKDIREDVRAYTALADRLSKMSGNLLELHKRRIPKDGTSITAPDGPMLTMIIDSWEVDGKRAYCLADCEDLNSA